MALRRVVITGLGGVSPFGIGKKQLMAGFYSNKSAVISQEDKWLGQIDDLNCLVGAPLQVELPSKTIPRRFRRTMGRSAMMALIATNEAIGDAQIQESLLSSGKVGVSFASTTGSVNSLTGFFRDFFKNASLKSVSSGVFFQVMSHTCAANIAHALNIRGRVISPNSACSSSTQAIGLGFEAIRHGKQDIMLCGGADELDAVVCGSFDMINATSYKFNDRPSQTPRPFDRDRDGTVCGEGAGTIVLEACDSAIERGAHILAEVAGFSTSSDGTHLAQPHSRSIVKCMKDALDDAHLTHDRIDYINAHATGTLLGDAAEAEAICEVFGEKVVPVSSLKGHIGHTLGACGAIELLASVIMLNDGKLIPTLNLNEPSEECKGKGIEHITSLREHRIDTFIKNSFAFGGINAVLILKRFDPQNA